MPPAKDTIKRNVKEIYINPKDYIIDAPKSEEEETGCANCQGAECYHCNFQANGAR